MENLVCRPTESSPRIFFDDQTNILEIRGSSYMENSLEFYTPVMTWIDSYLLGLKRHDKVQVDIELVYFNSSSSRVLVEIFENLNEKAFQDGINVDINWFYEAEDDDMLEFGREFQDDFQALAFHFSEICKGAGKVR